MSEKKFDYTKAVTELDEIAAKVEDPATSLMTSEPLSSAPRN